MTETLRDAICRALQRGSVFGIGIGLLEDDNEDNKLTETDRAFLNKWLACADHGIWLEILGTDHPPEVFPDYTFRSLVRFALRSNREAEAGRSGKDAILDVQEERHRKLLDLADKAAELAHFSRQQSKSLHLRETYEKEVGPLRELIVLHDALERFLRKSAGAMPKPTTIMPPRQDRRNGRTGLRKRRLFITRMSDCLTKFYDQKVDHPFHVDSLVAFTRIEFPDVTYAAMQKLLEPTTREGRRQRRHGKSA
jgi:hypothetical protein